MTANWIDRAIASVAPRTAARRVLARQTFETLARGYDGAARGRRTEGWRAPGASADTEIGMAGTLLRNRMRDLVRNNPADISISWGASHADRRETQRRHRACAAERYL